MSLSNPEVFEAAKVDPWLAIPGGLEAIRLYAAGFDRSDWRISPVFGDLSVLPKTLLLTGTRDILHPDSLVFAERARAAGVDVELFVEPGMIHVWPLIAIPEARRRATVSWHSLARDKWQRSGRLPRKCRPQRQRCRSATIAGDLNANLIAEA